MSNYPEVCSFGFPGESYFNFTNRRTKANMATTTTATLLTLRPTTTTNQFTKPQLSPQPVLMPLPLPTSHPMSHSPEAATALRSTTHTQRPFLHLPLTMIPFLMCRHIMTISATCISCGACPRATRRSSVSGAWFFFFFLLGYLTRIQALPRQLCARIAGADRIVQPLRIQRQARVHTYALFCRDGRSE